MDQERKILQNHSDKTKNIMSVNEYFNKVCLHVGYIDENWSYGLCWFWWFIKLMELQYVPSLTNNGNYRQNIWGVHRDWFFNMDNFFDELRRLGPDQYTKEFKKTFKFLSIINYISEVDRIGTWNRGSLYDYIADRYKNNFSNNSNTKIEDSLKGHDDFLIKILEIIKRKKFSKQHSIGALFTIEQIKQLLSMDGFFQDKKAAFFNSSDSSRYSVLLKNGDKYLYFNPANMGVKNSVQIQTSSINEVVESIGAIHSNHLGVVKDSEGLFKAEKYFPLGIRIFAFDENETECLDQKDILKLINPVVEINGQSSLNVAASVGSLESIQYFLEKGANPNFADKNGDTPIIMAIRCGKKESVEELILSGADPNMPDNDDYTPILTATIGKHLDIVRTLLEARANPNISDRSWTALECASSSGCTEIVKNILIARANINIRVWNDLQAFIYASNSGNIDIVKLLFKAGFDVDVQDISGNTALINATRKADINLVKELLKLGADTDKQNFLGNTALLSAVIYNIDEAVEILLANGADPDVQDCFGSTALMRGKALIIPPKKRSVFL